MRRRYDLRRSDNFPLTGDMRHICHGDGELFIYTGFPVQSVVIVPVGLPAGVELKTRTGQDVDDGFCVEFSGVPADPGIIHFSFTAQ